MNVDDERRLRRNWSFLKQELVLHDFLTRFVEHGVFTSSQRDEILNVMPSTKPMRMEKFLQGVLAAGNRGYQLLCNLLRENADNRYSRVLERMEISSAPTYNDTIAAESRPSTGLSSASSTVSSRDGETGERNVRKKHKREEISNPYESPNGTLVAAVAPVVAVPPERHTFPAAPTAQQSAPTLNLRRTNPMEGRSSDMDAPLFVPSPRTPVSVQAASSVHQQQHQQQQQQQQQQQPQQSEPHQQQQQSYQQQQQYNDPMSDEGLPGGDQETGDSGLMEDSNNTGEAVTASDTGQPASRSTPSQKMNSVDMRTLEQELVRMAPTIADLFQKINKQTSNVPNSEEELQRVREENERLRKTNKSLIEKLNTFQQKIIQLQLENRKLKDHGDCKKIRKEELEQKAHELKDMERRLEEQKSALEQKEEELNQQLCKLKEIEEENAEQKEKIDKLEELQDEGKEERIFQQEQIAVLAEEKERQREQIETLEERQKMGDQRLFRLEERLKMLEQVGRKPVGRRGVPRGVSPTGRNWMSGHVERSHHASVKFNSELKFNPEGKTSSSTRKGGSWAFTN